MLQRLTTIKAKLFDDPRYTGRIVDSFGEKRYSFQSPLQVIEPLLQVACKRPVWNMDMVKLLIEEGQVDVNAHHITMDRSDFYNTETIIQRKTALHILAQGEFWWQIEAITYLVEHGKLPF